ncbi:MAG: rhomboid family intramembrane serine protease, partial [Acidobacteriota bacterium]
MMKREIWRLTEGLVFMHFAVFFLTSTGQGSLEVLALLPGMVATRPWTLFTFQFIHGGMIFFFLSMLVFWIMARPLEELWGSPRFLAFYLISIG